MSGGEQSTTNSFGIAFQRTIKAIMESHHTYVISEEVLKKAGEITLDGRVISAQTQLKIIIQNSKQLHDNGWFHDLTKRKTKNPTRKDVI